MAFDRSAPTPAHDTAFQERLRSHSRLAHELFGVDPVAFVIAEGFRLAAVHAVFAPGQTEKIVAIFDAVLAAMEAAPARADHDHAEAFAVLVEILRHCRARAVECATSAP